ncbi:alpha/beta fold hydrolase [Nocardia nepalensis]|uniref:alpha/beta fold hydrolase n=1 Tax=Nocardia nepalensis TaxID=3375448 RepID=UPI003B67291F
MSMAAPSISPEPTEPVGADYSPPVGYHRFHPDTSINFQCNRWFNWIGPDSYDEIMATAHAAHSYPQWIDAFLALAARARGQNRPLAAAYYDRAAEFFMSPQDHRKTPARMRFLTAMRESYAIVPERIPYNGGGMSCYDLRPDRPALGDIIVFGGYDSYIEEFLPILTGIVRHGYRVIAFEGPGQGSTLEDGGLPSISEWEQPVSAVLDHYGLDDVTAIGISLGGGLVIRAAAFEPRIHRVIAYDILDDELEVVGRQIGHGTTPLLRLLLTLRARRVVNALARVRARRPIAQWGLAQGLHVTGASDPYDFLAAARSTTTRRISAAVTADVLLLAGADDHYVPVRQLHRQARALTSARSVTTRLFTAAESASSHCQIGNLALVTRTVLAWLATVDPQHADNSEAVR